MAKFTLLICNQDRASYKKGDVIDIRGPGEEFGNKTEAIPHFSFVDIEADSKADVIYLKEPAYSKTLEPDGGKTVTTKRRHNLSSIKTDAASRTISNKSTILVGDIEDKDA